jgi:DNA-binding FrmR family transcriptional regulator
MLEQQRTFTDIYMQLSAVKASIEEIEMMLIAQDVKLDKGSAALLKIMSRKMDALKELQ